MFLALFMSLVEFFVFAFVIFVIYEIFLSDWIAAKRAQWKTEKNKSSSIDKIAQVKLVSDDPKGIEEFVNLNAQYLSNQMVSKLVSRIEMLRTDQIITADEILKRRIEELENPEGEENAETIGSQRSSH